MVLLPIKFKDYQTTLASHLQQFKKDLTNGVQLQDANGVVMTADQVTAFLGALK